MKSIITGSVIFVIWSAFSIYYYVCKIKEVCPEETVEQTQVVVKPAVTPVPEPEPEPVKKLESPGSFTVFHGFDQDQFIPNERLDGYVDDLNAYLEQESSLKISVVGFTDNIGPINYNNELGLRRATHTKNFMVQNGVKESIITFSSQGESSPVATNDTDDGRAKNRRTEITITN